MINEQLTEAILAACFEVSNELGPGFLESVYEKALLIALQEKNIEAVNQVPIKVYFRGHDIGLFYADILVEDQVIVELKSCQKIAGEHIAQTIHYLKATGKEVALLVNFGQRKVEYRRLNNKTESL
ncbi:MAG: GxxExxY protein [Bacteroidales bacterium]|nr:GxxExxY protein [Bacteroidales bacterium]